MSFFKRAAETWAMLGRPIYTGERLRENLRGLTYAGVFSTVLGLVLLVINLSAGRNLMAIFAVMTSVFGAACAYLAGVLKNRRLAILSPTLFCGIMFAVYALTGVMDGAGILWSFLLPIGTCYLLFATGPSR